ncbi:MAG: hypothetical protein ACKO1H_12205, partial [Tabrizicola sp.]
MFHDGSLEEAGNYSSLKVLSLKLSGLVSDLTQQQGAPGDEDSVPGRGAGGVVLRHFDEAAR